MGSSLQKIFTSMAITVDPEVYDTMIADLQRAISAEIETAVAPRREGQRIAEERNKDLEGALREVQYSDHIERAAAIAKAALDGRE